MALEGVLLLEVVVKNLPFRIMDPTFIVAQRRDKIRIKNGDIPDPDVSKLFVIIWL
jgi:hypothetical protein